MRQQQTFEVLRCAFTSGAHFRRNDVTSGCQYAACCGPGKPSCLEDVSQVAGEDLLHRRYLRGACTVVRTRRSRSQLVGSGPEAARAHRPPAAIFLSENVRCDAAGLLRLWPGLVDAHGCAPAVGCPATFRSERLHGGEGVRQTVCERPV